MVFRTPPEGNPSPRVGLGICGAEQALGLSSLLRQILEALSSLQAASTAAVERGSPGYLCFNRLFTKDDVCWAWHPQARGTNRLVHLPQAGSPIRFSVRRVANDQMTHGLC